MTYLGHFIIMILLIIQTNNSILRLLPKDENETQNEVTN